MSFRPSAFEIVADEPEQIVLVAAHDPHVAEIAGLQAEISAEKLERKVGTVQRCLVDAIDGDLALARSQADAPEIDGLVQIQNGLEAGLSPGHFVDVQIMGSDEHDLYGEAVISD